MAAKVLTTARRQINRRQAGRGRFYLDADGHRYWSVTTILKGVPKQALVYWSAKEAATAAVDDQQIWRPMLDRPGGRDAAIKYLKDACWRGSRVKMDLGSLVHDRIEAEVLGRPAPPVPEEARGYLDGFAAFVADWTPRWVASELTVYSRTQAYAGTLDLIVELDDVDHYDANGRPVTGTARLLVDTKTGSGIYPEVALQLALYRHADFIELPDGTTQPVPQVDGGAALWLRDDGTYELIPVRTDTWVHRMALYAREVFRWTELSDREVIGEPMTPARRLLPVWEAP